MGIKHCITVDSVGIGCGLALFWHESVEVLLMEKHRRFIAVHVCENSTSPWFTITFVYGEPRTEAQHVDLTRNLRNASLVPLLLISDSMKLCGDMSTSWFVTV